MLQLQPVGRYPGLRVLAWHDGNLYAGHRYELLRWEKEKYLWQLVASFEPRPWRRLSSGHRLSARLFRDGYHSLVGLPDGTLIAILPKIIGVLAPGAPRFEETFTIPRGSRPLNLAVTPDGGVFWGEYFDNKERDEVNIYGSLDGGRSWHPVYTFPKQSIRHVHSINYDPYRNCLWILTGDLGEECRFLRASPDFSSVEVVLSGNQQARAVSLLPFEDGVYFATDTPLEQNYIYHLTQDGRLDRLFPVNSSVFYTCRVSRAMFFSTVVEPSPVNHDQTTTLLGSADGKNFVVLLRWPRDIWPLMYFQYPNIFLPTGDNDSDILAVTGWAVRGEDQTTNLFKVRGDG
jgi:hypothetical protein